jgi:hypothetical protein
MFYLLMTGIETFSPLVLATLQIFADNPRVHRLVLSCDRNEKAMMIASSATNYIY